MPLFPSQPPAFRLIFLLELWERFGYYIVQGLLILYLIRSLGFTPDNAYLTFGAFFALVYAFVVIGGFMGDKILGRKRTIIVGLGTLALGYFGLAFASRSNVHFALGLICVGNGLFKANPVSLLAQCYEPHDSRLSSGFTLYYMAVNLGSTFSLLLGPALANSLGYFYAYLMSFFGLILGLANYYFQRHYVAEINNEADKNLISIRQWTLIVLGILITTYSAAYLLQHIHLTQRLLSLVVILVLIIYSLQMQKVTPTSRKKMAVALILMIEAVAFFILYQQMPTSLNLFAVNNVRPNLLGISIDPQSFQALNPVWIILISPMLAKLYTLMDKWGVSFPTPYKFALGMICCGLSFILLYFSRAAADVNFMVSPWWLVGSYFFQSTGELLVSALGAAMIAELVPETIAGFVMGMWFLAPAIAGFLGATVATLTIPAKTVYSNSESLILYTQVFSYIGIISIIFGVIMWLIAGYLTQYIRCSRSS